jgi:hypothetical protein
MQTFPPLPDWCSLEHQVAQILTQQEQHGWYFNERQAYELESTLTLSLQERNLLLSEITKLLVTMRDAPLLVSKNSIQQAEITLHG